MGTGEVGKERGQEERREGLVCKTNLKSYFNKIKKQQKKIQKEENSCHGTTHRNRNSVLNEVCKFDYFYFLSLFIGK